MAKTHSAKKVASRGSLVIRVLEAALEKLRKIDPRIPSAVITLVDAKSRRRTRGYFVREPWKNRRGRVHEIGISPDLLGHPNELLATFLHEAAHAILEDAGKHGGIGAGGYYHNTDFRDLCLEFGLLCEFLNTRYGFTLTSWPRGRVPQRFLPVRDYLRNELPTGTGAARPRLPRGRTLPASGHTLLTCGCRDVRRTISVSKSMLEVGGIVCRFCGLEFQLPE